MMTGVPRLPDAVREAVAAMVDKKALDIVLLDLREAGAFTDFFVVGSGRTTRQVQAIADAVNERLRAIGARPEPCRRLRPCRVGADRWFRSPRPHLHGRNARRLRSRAPLGQRRPHRRLGKRSRQLCRRRELRTRRTVRRRRRRLPSPAAAEPPPPSRRCDLRRRLDARSALDAVLAVAWASRCIACELPLDSPTRGVVCAACLRQIPRLSPPVCDRCGLPAGVAGIGGEGDGAAPCRACRQNRGPATPRRAAGLHDGPLRAMIHALKYGGRRSLARPLAAMLREAADDWLRAADAVVPVPLHPLRRWRRGFNQADDIARRLGRPVIRPIRRARHTRPQMELPRSVRLRAVRGAFTLTRPPVGRAAAAIRGRRLLLVDDVITTGATVEACAALLRDGGAADVRVLGVALAPQRGVHRRPDGACRSET